ncbi:lipid-A-disaccharide synthase N-terminal domain-containing protein [Agrobacterium tumefaciens]|uniref:lipid-A-disaccharide synthase N-terminal domain-containing protein n=1 Tax=Agrobacterium TaxID=357 RepID=UPI00119EFACB|nr:lipid-A-disaccharide synthase N-terminal domain-containing protein [Agrobacterium sp. DE0009]
MLHVNSWEEFLWVCTGFMGQMLFTTRFLLQWISSERANRSVMPVTFWYFSVLGGLVLLSYAVWRRDPVFVIGQASGLLIYFRNLWLIHAERRQHA